MHSSRMRAARLLTVSQHALHRGGSAQGVSPRGVCVCLIFKYRMGVCLRVCARGVSAWGVSAQGALDRMTDTLKNITFPQTSFAGGITVKPVRLSELYSHMRLFGNKTISPYAWRSYHNRKGAFALTETDTDKMTTASNGISVSV